MRDFLIFLFTLIHTANVYCQSIDGDLYTNSSSTKHINIDSAHTEIVNRIDTLINKVDSLGKRLNEAISKSSDLIDASGKAENIASINDDIPDQKNIQPDILTKDFNLDSETLNNAEEKIELINSRSEKIPVQQEVTVNKYSESLDTYVEQMALKQDELMFLKEEENNALLKQQDLLNEIKAQKEHKSKINSIKGQFRQKFEKQLSQSIIDHQHTLKEAQRLVKRYKRNPYIRIGNADMQKRNSFKKVPVKKRLAFGGNFQVSSYDPFILSASPQFTYLFLPEFRYGLGAVFGLTTTKNQDVWQNTLLSHHGYRTFIEWDGLKKIFLHAEFEIENGSDENNSQSWNKYYLGGIGTRFSYSSSIKGAMMLLYNPNYKSGNTYSNPWIFRVGMEISANIFKGKSK